MTKLQEKFASQFITESVELDGERLLYAFDKNEMDQEKIDAAVESFNMMFEAQLFGDSFDAYLDHMEIGYVNLGYQKEVE